MCRTWVLLPAEPAWETALAADCPVVIDAVTDPEILTFTPESALQFAKKLTKAIEAGEEATFQKLEDSLRRAVSQERDKL